jgi:hypothetical protein
LHPVKPTTPTSATATAGGAVREADPEFLRALNLLREVQAAGAFGMRVEEEKDAGSTGVVFFRRDDVPPDIAEKAAEIRRLLKLPPDPQKFVLTYSPAGAKLTGFKMEIIGGVLLLLLIVLGPLLVFSPRLMQTKRSGLRDYGMLVDAYVREFDLKWVRGGATADERLLGSGDVQSLADMGNSFRVIRDIRPVPFDKNTVIHLVVCLLIPVSPLVLTMIPLEELIRKLAGAVF